MNILICDDEPLAIDRLSRLVTESGHHVLATANNAEQAIQLVKELSPDVVLLDIQMPGMNGLVCAEQLNQFDPMPAIVFCTAYENHAIDAFKSQPQGYLLKPVAHDELEYLLDKLTKLTQAQVRTLKSHATPEKNQRQHISAKTYRGIELVPVEDIYFFLADQKYVTVRHKEGSVLIDETLKELETEFGDRFIRIHRNALVSVDHIDGLELVASGQYQVRCRGLEVRLAVSRRHLANLRERMHKL